MIKRFLAWLLGPAEPARLAVVRRYVDANGSYVGELYLYEEVKRRHDMVTGYVMIGASLDSLPFDLAGKELTIFGLDTYNDFLQPLPPMTLRVGSLEPKDNDAVRRRVAKLPRKGMTLLVQNGFIEHVMKPKEGKV